MTRGFCDSIFVRAFALRPEFFRSAPDLRAAAEAASSKTFKIFIHDRFFVARRTACVRPAERILGRGRFVVRRPAPRDNDFLAEMQRSIDLLSEKYNQVLQENVMLQQEKAQWQVAQQTLLTKVDRLTREVEDLRRRISPRLFNRIKL